jgi:hypothetical protein
MTVCDLRSVRPGAGSAVKGIAEPNARVAVDAQSRALIDLVIDAVLAYD